MGTEQHLAQQHREKEQVVKEQQRSLAAAHVLRNALLETWPAEDVDEVLGALGLQPPPPPL
jgi:hypothetical protein